MSARVLPAAEWSRLSRAPIGALLETLQPQQADVVVVEAEGEVVACCATLKLTHLEGLWISRDHRGGAGVARALLRGLNAVVPDGWVLAATSHPKVQRMLERIGAERLPVEPDTQSFKVLVN